ncbi:MAG: hypothetical protein J5809_07570 [Selenomonadaceae bacterium]|nr:hypothetical protein [Selenomonadaceae bacterium]
MTIYEVSPTGANEFVVRGFKNRQKLMNHWQNGRTHREEYPYFTMEQYERRAIELAESAVGENILGHVDKDGYITRYDKLTNDFVKGHPYRGIVTMFKPIDGENYYLRALKGDLEHGGRS